MSRYSRRLGYWIGWKLKGLIGGDTTKPKSFDYSEIQELFDRVAELELLTGKLDRLLENANINVLTLEHALALQSETLSELRRIIKQADPQQRQPVRH